LACVLLLFALVRVAHDACMVTERFEEVSTYFESPIRLR